LENRVANCDHFHVCLPNLVNIGPQVVKNRTWVSIHSKSTFSDTHIAWAKGHFTLKISHFVEDDQRLVMHTCLGMRLPPTIFSDSS